MALEKATYLVTREIAERAGLVGSRYITDDGRFVLNDRDLNRIRLRPDEYVHGLEGIEQVSSDEAKKLMRKNNFRINPYEEVLTTTETEEVEVPVENGEQSKTENINDNNEISEE